MPVSATKYLDKEGLSYFWGKIKSYVGEAVESGTSDIANKIHFVVPDQKSATATLTASVDGITALAPGLVIALRMPFSNYANTTLNINNLGAKPLYYNSVTTSSGRFPSGSVILLVYETTSNANGCFKAVYSYDSDVVYSTSLYAAGSTSATSNAYSATEPDSTYLVSVDRNSGGSVTGRTSVKLLGSGSISVTADDGIVTFDSPAYDRIDNEMIDALYDNEYVYIDKTFRIPSRKAPGVSGLIYTILWNTEDGSDTGLDYVTYSSEHENENQTVNVPSNQDYELSVPVCKLSSFVGYNASGIAVTIAGYDEDDVYQKYHTVGSSITGCASSKYSTFSGTLVNAEASEHSPSMGHYWDIIEFDPTEINGPSGEITIDLEFNGDGFDDYNDTFSGRMVAPGEPKFRVTFFKDQSGTNVMMKIRYVCVM